MTAVEVGNEPNLGLEWGNSPPNAADYVSVLRATYSAFKTVAPEIIVVSAGLASTLGTADGMNVNDLTFAQQMFDAGAADYFDAFAYHPYGYDQPPEADPFARELVFRRSERMYGVMIDNGVRERQMWLTEFGWLRDPAEIGLNCNTQDDFPLFAWMTHSAAEQATYTVRAFNFADANWPWAGPMFLWNLDWDVSGNSNVGPCSHLRLFSILNEQAVPFPAYYAYQDMPKRYVDYDAPSIITVSAVVNSLTEAEHGGSSNGLTRTVQAGCDGLIRLGSFTVITGGFPNTFTVDVEPVNGPGVPRAWTSASQAVDGSVVSMFVDTRDVPPGLYQISVNLRSNSEQRMATYAVRGWLLVHFPSGSSYPTGSRPISITPDGRRLIKSC